MRVTPTASTSQTGHHARVPLTALALAALLPIGSRGLPLAAQAGTPPDSAPASEPDSLAPLDRAREAQRRFEALRGSHLPPNHAWEGGSCDDQVGRICWRHQTLSWWRAERDVPVVLETRGEIIDELARIAREVPGDEWILGQRVWYLLEAERLHEALDVVVSECDGRTGWWCEALEGLVLHVQGRFVESESAFGRALAAMEPEEARRWEAMEGLLDEAGEKVLEGLAERAPAQRDSLLRLAWSMADPLRLAPGNDRRTEHLARRTAVRIRSQAHEPFGMPWMSDFADLMLRYGWEVAWERAAAREGAFGDGVTIVGHDHADSRGYMPPGRVLAHPFERLRPPWTPSGAFARSAYAPAYAPVMLPMPSRIVVLTRGDSSLVAATFDLPADTTHLIRDGYRTQHRPPPSLVGTPIQAGLFLTGPDGEEVRSARLEGATRGVLKLMAPAGSYRVSVEVLEPGAWRAGRLRNGAPVPRVLPDVATLSELLLLEAGPPPADIDEALSRLRTGEEVHAGEPIVVAWELWGLGWREETLRYRLSVRETGGGFLRSVGGLFGLGQRASVVLEWQEPGPARPGAALRSASMDLPALEPGEYVLRLEVTAPGRSTLVSEQRLEVRGPAETAPG